MCLTRWDALDLAVLVQLVGGPAGTMEGGRQAEVAKAILTAKNVPYVVAAPLLIQVHRNRSPPLLSFSGKESCPPVIPVCTARFFCLVRTVELRSVYVRLYML